MPLPCPRCELPLAPRTAAPHPDVGPITAEVCERCGLWIDGDLLASVSPKLEALRPRRTTLPVPPQGALTCPRCRVYAARVHVSRVWIDVCRTCAGVWLDAGEYEAIVRADRKSPAAPVATRAVVPLPDELHCAACGALAKRSLTYVTAKGHVCAGCHAQAEMDAPDKRGPPLLDDNRSDAVVNVVAVVFGVVELLGELSGL